LARSWYQHCQSNAIAHGKITVAEAIEVPPRCL
jgi:hypothetical protein